MILSTKEVWQEKNIITHKYKSGRKSLKYIQDHMAQSREGSSSLKWVVSQRQHTYK